MGVAEAAIASSGNHRALTRLGEIREQDLTVFFIDLRSSRHFQHDILTARTVAVLAHSGAAVLGFEMLLVAVVYERVEAIDRLYDDVTTLAAVAAVRPAEFDEFFPPERYAAIPAVAGAYINLGFIKKFHDARYAMPGAKYESPRGRAARTARTKSGEKDEMMPSTRREGPGRAMPY
jgi:hypothetical protein